MDNYRIEMAQRRLNRGRLHDKQVTETVTDNDITHVTQVTVEDTADVSEIIEQEPDTRTLREIYDDDCTVKGEVSYKIFAQRVNKYGWSLERALHEGKAR